MKKIAEYPALIPSWAMSYIYNADSSGITDEDKKMVDDYFSEFEEEGHIVVSIDQPEDAVSSDEMQEPSFRSCPDFGLAADCYDCTITVFAREK